MPRFDIVVSAENNNYLVWQAMLFHYSCLHLHGQTPIVVVHKGNEPLQSGFERIVAAGGIVQTAPDYRHFGGIDYAARHTAATLRHVQSDADYLVLCDPDMIFLKPLPLHKLALGSQQISFDAITYLDPNGPEYQPVLDDVCRRAGVEPRRLRERPIDGGVPHIIPAGLQHTLSDAWLEIIELFPTIASGRHVGPQKDWLATMWAVVLAVHRLGLESVMTHWCVNNFRGADPLPPSGPCMIHYCYGDAGFDKRKFDTRIAAEHDVWQVAPGDTTTSGVLRGQLTAARAFYGIKSARE